MVVLTVVPSSCTVIGSSTMSSSGLRARSPPVTVVTSSVSLRLRGAIPQTVAAEVDIARLRTVH